MGKSAKAKKEKKAAFTKVKLKVGKKLPKGQNLTDTSFKAKKIFIGEQLKKPADDEPVTKKKLGLKDLLSHLRHYSAYVRQDGLNGLRELLTAHPEMLLTSLHQVISATAALLVDDDHKLRTETVAVITQFVARVSEQQMGPFFSALMAHVTCAMTHISASVRQSALPLLSALLCHYPSLVSARADQLLPTLLQLISRTSGASGDGARVLLSDPDWPVSPAAWRVTVLQQLAVVLRYEPEPAEDATYLPDVSASAHVGLPRHRQPAHTLCFTDLHASGERRTLTDPHHLRSYAASLVPLMFQAYTEVAPENDADDSLLSDEAAETLYVIVDLLVALLRLMQRLDADKRSQLVSWFGATYGADLETHVFAAFPYSRSVGQRRSSAGTRTSTGTGTATGSLDLGSDAVNMLVCELAACLGSSSCGEQQQQQGSRAPVRAVVLRYLSDYLSAERYRQLPRACRVLLSLLADCAGGGAELARRRGCLRAAAERHACLQPQTEAEAEARVALTRLLEAVVTEEPYRSLARCVEVQEWGTQLLHLVTPDCDHRLLVLLRRIAVLAESEFLSALRTHAVALLNCAARASDIVWQRRIVELLCWPIDVTADAQLAYQQFVTSETVHPAVKRYACRALEQKYAPKVDHSHTVMC